MGINYTLSKSSKSKSINSKKKFREFRKKLSLINIKNVKKNIKLSNSKIIIIFLIIFLLAGSSYAAFDYYKISNLIKEAEQFTKEESHKEAIEKLTVAQVSWFVKNLGIRKEKINDDIRENEQMLIDKKKYDEALLKINEKNYKNAIITLLDLPESSYYYQDAQIKIKESENFLLESELIQVKEAKRIADQRRMQKEQELAEKEAEERKMNADNDGDGLTYRRELELGTSDWNTDSDSDGIIDSEDAHPAGGGRNIPQTFAWSYGGHNWTWTESIQEDWHDYYRAKQPRSSPESVEYITSDDPFIKKISKKISENANAKSNINEVWLAISFVQNLPYVDDVFTGYDEYPKYPVETFFEKNGDCEDTSYLAASIIDAMGYGAVLILLPGHMAVGVYMNCDTSGTYYEFEGRCYYYVETTSKDWTGGEIPDRYRNTLATLIKVPSGKTADVYPKYKKPCYASSDFSGYYFDGENYYSDNQCNYLTSCLLYEEFYYNPRIQSFYWDSGCVQIVTKGCSKSTSYPGYFYDDYNFYYDSRCIQKAKICRLSSYYSDRYWDGDYNYWDSNCTQKIVSWCSKSTYNPGYFFNSLDYDYYYDYQCTQKADL